MPLSIRHCFFFLLTLCPLLGIGQAPQGALRGRILDATTKEPLIGATVLIVSTYKGGTADLDGDFTITGIKPGDYSIKVSFVGFVEKVYTGIRIGSGEPTVLNVSLKEAGQTLEQVEIIGQRAVVDLESGKSEVRISANDIKEMTARSVQDVVSLQAGVSVSPDGLQIRGGRVYETQYVVDGINAQDPLAGTGFGVQVQSNAVQDVTLVTGGSGAEYNGNSGVVVTRIKEGGDRLQLFGRWQRDNFGFNQNVGSAWNTDIVDLSLGGPIAGTKKKLKFFVSGQFNANDTYFRVQANQLSSSLFANSDRWAPRQDNSWSGTAKLSYELSPATKISITNQSSLLINQNTRSLQIIGFNAIMVPGFQYGYTLQPDNATTYAHRSNLTVLGLTHKFNNKWRFNVDVGRLFVNLRADANGRPFRNATIDQILDPQNITTGSVSVYNPNDTGVVFVNPGNGFINNGGISETWHDHWVEEYTLKYKFLYSPNQTHTFTFGHEHRQQAMQWVDVTRPWVGQPLQLADGSYTSSRSIGSSSDVWKVKPRQGGFWVEDQLRYKGILATLGARLEYWAPGDLATNAVNDPAAPVVDETRRQYMAQTIALLGQRWKARFLPRINVSFPVTENNVMYFNYSHSMRLPHPRFVYAGLDPVYQDRSQLADLGNPNLNPEVAVAYELGVKSQINRDLGITFTAFYKDQFDFIVSRTATIIDAGGRSVDKTISINQDYARIRGAEVMVNYRVSDRIRAMANGSFQVATGKSNSALESKLQIRNNNQVNTTQEQYLAWDRPFDLKGTIILTPDSGDRFFRLPLKGVRIFVSSTFKSGLRYTPVRAGEPDELGRVRYESIDMQPYSKIGTSWFWTDLRITKDFRLFKRLALSASVEITNLFNNENAQIINPVTGTAYRSGDQLPYSQRDPNFTGPQTGGLLPNNPARYLQPRQILYGISLSF